MIPTKRKNLIGDKMKTQIQATHTDEFGNLYHSISETPAEFCVDYLDKRTGEWAQDVGKDFSHLIPLKKAWSATQCKAPCGTTGTFLFHGKNESGYILASPVFVSWAELGQWIRVEGWKSVGGLTGWYEKE